MRNSKGSLVRPAPFTRDASSPLVTPLSPSVAYASDTPDALDDQYEGRAMGYTYSREGHPNAAVVAERMDIMENMSGGIVTGSGMGAITAVLMGLLKSGDHVIGGNQLYGRSLRLMKEDLPRLGITTSLADPVDVGAMRAAIRPQTRMILIEIASNPSLRIADIDGIAAVCREHGILLVVDNTFTTPRAIQPFDHGADIVIHSITKLLAGHSDVMLGYVVARDTDLNTQIRVFAVTTGLTPSPYDCWLAERGMLSFDLRFDRSQATASVLADHIAGLDGVKRVIYPMRKDHPDHARAVELLNGQGGNMVSFELTAGRAAANAFTRAAEGLAFAPTLGDVGTTLSHPASSSHRILTPEDRSALGLSEGFFRISVGLEDAESLKTIFTDAIAAASAAGEP
ncbi:MAG: aminotransferase class I/II-fold pyridoxal phosphate-dependent enzyme [Rhodobacteraceae bacterium]|nr:aminotransferase class I/II-fold pyridoxal phosphate-dependent enzyme [Paracoccaceae bacterium]